jgi:2'-5' RNA ligase
VGKIGVAIPVPEPAGGELAAWRAQLGDPEAKLIVPHVTLLPPTTIPALALPTVADHLAAVVADSAPFRIELRGSSSFRPASPTVFVALAVGSDDCRRLEKAVRAGPLARELRHPYHPHVTVAHDLAEQTLDRAQVSLAGFAAEFAVRALTLFEQQRGGEWRPLRELAFGSTASRTSEEPAAGAAGSSEEN